MEMTGAIPPMTSPNTDTMPTGETSRSVGRRRYRQAIRRGRLMAAVVYRTDRPRKAEGRRQKAEVSAGCSGAFLLLLSAFCLSLPLGGSFMDAQLTLEQW